MIDNFLSKTPRFTVFSASFSLLHMPISMIASALFFFMVIHSINSFTLSLMPVGQQNATCYATSEQRIINGMGCDTIGKGTGSYVKYDPAYIYNSGLQTFEILRSPQVAELIYSASKAIHDAAKTQKSNDEDTADDAADKSGLFQFCSFPHIT